MNPPSSTTPPPAPPGFDRRHDLDALRATAMLLGIGLHGALAYTTISVWPIQDEQRHIFFDRLFSMVHAFRMPLFFLLSGFFTAMLWRKRGLGSLIWHRTRRVFFPMLLFLVVIWGLSLLVFGGIGWMEARKQKDPENTLAQMPPDSLWSAAKQNNTIALEAFLEETEDLDQKDLIGFTALHWASLNGSSKAAELLIQSGADVNLRHEDGSSSLGYAAFMGHSDIVEMLIEAGADLNPVSRHQVTPLDSAYADWKTVQWVAGMLQLQADQASVNAGQKEAIALLKAAGAKHRAEVDLTQIPSDKAGHSSSNSWLGRLTATYDATTAWPIYRVLPIFGHLWFLWFLCILVAWFVPYSFLTKALFPAGPPSWLFAPGVLLLWLVPLTMIPAWFFDGFGPDTSLALFPLPHILFYYAIFFFVGALYFDRKDQSIVFGRYWWILLPLALLLIYPVGATLLKNPDDLPFGITLSAEPARLLSVLLQALYTWLMIFGLMGLFRQFCPRENRTIRYISDSSYWLYLLHIPLIFLAQYWVKPLEVSVFVKFGLVCLGLTGFLLLTYQLLVRYTWIGTLLNGKRVRGSSLSSA